MGINTGRRWRVDDETFVIDNPDMPPEEMAQRLGRSVCAITKKRNALGVRYNSPFESRVTSLWHKLTTREIALVLDVSPNQVSATANNLGLGRNRAYVPHVPKQPQKVSPTPDRPRGYNREQLDWIAGWINYKGVERQEAILAYGHHLDCGGKPLA